VRGVSALCLNVFCQLCHCTEDVCSTALCARQVCYGHRRFYYTFCSMSMSIQTRQYKADTSWRFNELVQVFALHDSCATTLVTRLAQHAAKLSLVQRRFSVSTTPCFSGVAVLFADMAQMSAALKAQSKEYSKSAGKLYRSAVFQKYLPLLVIAGIVVLVLLFRWLYS
jgi:hypothetical protein